MGMSDAALIMLQACPSPTRTAVDRTSRHDSALHRPPWGPGKAERRMMELTMTDRWHLMTRPATSVPTVDDDPSDAPNDARLRPSRRKMRKRKSPIPAAATAIEAREGDELTEDFLSFFIEGRFRIYSTDDDHVL